MFYKSSWLAVCWEPPILLEVGIHPFALATIKISHQIKSSLKYQKIHNSNEVPDSVVARSSEHILHLSPNLPANVRLRTFNN